ncbi:uncharacterized protein LOC141629480 [Silene latifolia]|uniref:uncharacterized protein LOC141629480 n=1 Tax=Silene latifolia TaxID=37657 RepID=UPI003D76FC50
MEKAKDYLRNLAKRGCYGDGIRGKEVKQRSCGFHMSVADVEMVESSDSSSVNDTIETKCKACNVGQSFRSLGFVMMEGVDAVGKSGGLWVGWHREAKMSLVMKCKNFMILFVEKYNGKLWYLVLFYGEQNAHLRDPVLSELEEWLERLDYPFLIVGDFNQVENSSDKLSSSQNPIQGMHFFNNWKISNDLMDIPFKGPKFTWCNNRKGNKRVYERIDKALASKDWFTFYPNTGIKHYPIQISDHAPIELNLDLTRNLNMKPYKLEAWALEYKECVEVIENAWKISVRGSPAFTFLGKLKHTRQMVKKWSLDKRKGWNEKWEDFDKRLELGMEKAITEGNDEEYTIVNEEVREFAKAAALYWKQRAKVRWLTDGDGCTKFFFNWVTGRAGRNYILGIKGENRDWIYDLLRVKEFFQRSFNELYAASIGSRVHDEANNQSPDFSTVLNFITRSVTADDADFLNRPFTAKEVRCAVFQMGALKSPGPDGIPAVFYQKCWGLIKNDFVKAALSILNSGMVLREMNRTFIALIPKCENPEGVKDYRPISLCNVFMRVITKCVTNRLAKIMTYLVSDFQNAFIQGRLNSDNILLANEAVHRVNSHKRGKYGRLVFKADMSKAYDRVRWDFLRAVLKCFGFPNKIINLIMNCVSTVSYEILFNGAPLQQFQPRCGLRQGDPLSPYLFILCMEVLSSNMVQAQLSGSIRGINICKKILRNYCKASGQVLNEQKSGVLFSPSTTLGRATKCLPILKIRNNKGIGKSGKVTHWCSKNFFSQPKSSGGLGIRNIECLNQALLAKHAWRILGEQDSLFCKSFRDLVLGNGGLIGEAVIKTRSYGSWSVRSIRYGLNLILNNIGWKPSFVSNLNVWSTRWVNGETPEPNNRILGPEFAHLKDLRIRDLYYGNGDWKEEKIRQIFEAEDASKILAIPWCASRKEDEMYWIHTGSGEYTVKSGYGVVFKSFMDAKGTTKDKERLSTKGQLFCKSRLWRLPGPRKWKFLLWKILSKTLPIGRELLRRNLQENHSCCLCNGQNPTLKTLTHLFRDCEMVKRIWVGSALGITPSCLGNMELDGWIINWITYLNKLADGEKCVIQFLAILWNIWAARNNIMFRGDVFHPGGYYKVWSQTVSEVMNISELKEKGSMGKGGDVRDQTVAELKRIREGYPYRLIGEARNCEVTRVKVDAGWKKSGEAGIWWVAYTGVEGESFFEGMTKLRAESALQAEALGVRRVLAWARDRGLLHLDLSSDCLQLVAQIAGLQEAHRQVKGVLKDILALCVDFHCLCVSFRPRSLNKAAHGLACEAMNM